MGWQRIRMIGVAICCVLVSLSVAGTAWGAKGGEGIFRVGAAEVDVTPDYPIRLSGYAARGKESAGVEQHLKARALAIGGDAKGAGAALLVTVDNVGISDALTRELARRLSAKVGVPRERLVLCATHSHTAPMLAGVLPNLFGAPLPPEQQATVERYTGELLDKLEKVALDAVAARRPARLAWGQGEAGFAANRRTRGGPVDHALPVLCATGVDGKLMAIVVNYACHCTSIDPAVNTICGDWAGYACEDLERDHPGTVVLQTIGCGGDANPNPRGTVALAQRHGREVADEVGRLLKAGLKPVAGALQTHFEEIRLPFDKPPTRQQWEELARRPDAAGGNARLQLARLGRGEAVPRELPYQVAAWNFGGDLAMVFLAGEVVVDYDLRLKHDFDAGRLWVTAYANSVPCYIPSRRVLAEGGYEAEGAMVYYGQPGRLAPGVEDQIVEAVHDLLPAQFRSAQSLNEFPLPLSPQQAMAAFRTREDLVVELVASEPLVVDPVYIDWGPDGRLWVVEMNDYPNGLAENHTPGGRIKVLQSTLGDGRYDKATTFAEGLRMPTGVMPWGDGALVCAAPDILYLHDTKGTGRADAREVLFSGFGPENEQWLVNGLTPGLDNWLYGASSIANGPIRVGSNGKAVDLGQRDFRLRPDTRQFEPASGRTQYVRVRDDWDEWFGNDNSNLLFHYPLPEAYLRRNPAAAPPPSHVLVPAGYDVNELYPASRILPRFNDPGSAGRTTSACGPTIYRDELLGREFAGNAFACEPVHNLVTRLVLESKGATFTGRRSDDNAHSEFLASTDNWFRPVQVRTGPDGALWVVDMYRFVIEHPRWITPQRLATLDVRAGADKGRIYRVYPRGAKPRPIPDLTKLDSADLVARLDNPNGPLRDLIQRELVRRGGKDAAAPLQRLARSAAYPAARAQAMWTLEGLGALSPDVIAAALGDADARVRRQALRLAEPRFGDSPAVSAAALRLANDPDPKVRYQLALSLGAWDDPRAADVLGRLAVAGIDDPWMRTAVVTAAGKRPAEVLAILLKAVPDRPGRGSMVSQLIATAGANADAGGFARLLSAVAPAEGEPVAAWRTAALAAVLDAMQRRDVTLASVERSADASARDAAGGARRVIDAARKTLRDAPGGGDDAARVAGIGLIGRAAASPGAGEEDVRLLASLLQPQAPAALQQAALAALGKTGAAPVAGALLERWAKSPPALRESILQTLLTRKEWTAALLDALANGKVRPAEIGAAPRSRLLAAADPALRDRARALLSAATPSARKQVLETYKPALALKGDPARGVATFAKTCTACHQLAGQGHAVGPDLTALTDRSPQALLVAILDPNAAVDGKYVDYVVDVRDGRTLSGIIADETANALTVLQPNGLRDTVARGDITSLRSTGLSLMPEGLEAGLSPQDLADLMAYVAAARPAAKPKSVPGNEPRTVRADKDGRLTLRPADAEIHGTTLTLEAQYKNLGMWNSDDDYAAWAVEVPRGGRFDVWLDYACSDDSAGNAFLLEIGDARLEGTVAGTAAGNWGHYRRVKVGQVTLPAGPASAALRPAKPVHGALLDLKGIELVPAGP